ncbi:MAG: pyroglutamyl-peptidase I, partial [Coriobacteriia bacterium]
METTRVLVTGFEAFAGAASNPSGEVVRRLVSLPQEELAQAGVSLSGVVLPVAFAASGTALNEAIEAHRPDLVVALGLAEGRDGITPERVAINLDDARIADNDGAQPIDEPIEPGGPAARFSGLPVKAIVAALSEAGIPASVSLTAGSYVCNHVAYLLGGHAERRPGMRAGFIHVPATPDLV